jgi:hypothetical protein
VSKINGLGMRFLTGGYDISGDVNAIDTISTSVALWDTTDITQSAHSRTPTLKDGSMAFTVFLDTANAHPVLSALPTTDTIMAALVQTTLGNPAACLNAKQVGYDPTRSATGELTLKVSGEGNSYGLEWGKQLTAGLRTDTTATAGTTLDNGAQTTFGAQAYLQVTAFTGTDTTIIVEHSSDDSSYSALITFTQVTAAPFAQRASVSNVTTVKRYLRAYTTTSAGFSSATFSVVVMRNLTAGVVF